MKEDTRKLVVTGKGRTYYVTIPRWMIEQLEWRKGQKVTLKLRGKRISIEDWEKQSVSRRS